jgi:hypothetical protein
MFLYLERVFDAGWMKIEHKITEFQSSGDKAMLYLEPVFVVR